MAEITSTFLLPLVQRSDKAPHHQGQQGKYFQLQVDYHSLAQQDRWWRGGKPQIVLLYVMAQKGFLLASKYTAPVLYFEDELCAKQQSKRSTPFSVGQSGKRVMRDCNSTLQLRCWVSSMNVISFGYSQNIHIYITSFIKLIS